MPSNSPADAPLLIVAVSGQALARSARRGGLRPYVIDLFGDLDTAARAERHAVISWRDGGFDAESLRRAVQALDPGEDCALVCGSGFEATPWLVSELAQRRTLLGNLAEVIETVKNPLRSLMLLDSLGIPHPPTRFDPPAEPGWLAKRAGGSGGGHVHWADGVSGERLYYQRHMPGRSLSATFVADGRAARLLGFCEQFCAVLPEHPFTYGGAVTLRPGDLPSSLPSELADACTALVAATGLRGLCGIDVIAADARWWLIDINPRPGATFALHERTASLLRLHIDAVRGHLPKVRVSVPAAHRGHAIVYAPRRIETRAWRWPAWVSDRPRPMLAINAGEPICTVHAQAAQPCEVSATLRARQNHILNLINMW